MRKIQISKKGILIADFTLSWIMVTGIIVTLTSATWVFFFLPKNQASSLLNGDSQKTNEETQSAGDTSNNDESAGTKGSTKKSTSKSTTGNQTSGVAGNDGATSDGVTSLSLIALGDSITNAASPTSSMPGDNKSYSFSTGSNINSVYRYLISIGQNISPTNLAVSGAKSVNVLAGQVPQVSSYNPSYITLLVGGNDMLSLLSGEPVTPEQFQSNLSSIASQIKSSGRKILIGTIPNYSVMWQAGYPTCANYPYPPEIVALAISQYNSIISSVASQNGMTLVNLYPYLGTGDVSDYDCLHPNLSGQQKIADRFISGL
ncbi:MAG: hypothetical protein Athens101428_631 [Candidatus Berkelbacteria bacterium Athens1014_28]|uniref:SGNH hydrolase-type esterase domain-containing protein n=1 Tax=Candidatus Berkelbacteria bacterium Athens1014_28 TaxID=2017145 RepID=A0A554LL43_9BACT|nr:MAG: hypothetical protein Athens101428_631 [Candidatus Berkelbacteria bacterium Athens1014_28]